MTVPCLIDPGTVIEDFTDTTLWTKNSAAFPLYHHRRCLDSHTKKGILFTLMRTATPTTGMIWRTDKSIDMSAMSTVTLQYQYMPGVDSVHQNSSLSLVF